VKHFARFPVLGAVILSTLWGCDNVTWGGAEVSLEPPPPAPGAEEGPEPQEEVDTLPALPEGQVLFVVRRDPSGARIVPVAEMARDSLLPFPTEQERPGFTARYISERLVADREFTLMWDGARVGRFIAGPNVEPDSSYCQARPSVGGVIEVVPEAATQDVFLAVSTEGSEHLDRVARPPIASNRGQRVASLRVAGELISEAGARFPSDLVATRGDLRLLPLRPSAPPTMLATFLFRDRLLVEVPAPTAYSMFFVAEDAGAGYEQALWLYRPVDLQGKGAPRYLAHADWDGDGEEEVLLDVLGSQTRWLAALDRLQGRWRLAFQDPCGAPSDGRGAS
jgi:hypothetical protein